MSVHATQALDLSQAELLQLRELGRAIDELLEHSLKARESLDQTFRRLLPEVLRLTGASAAIVTTRNEHLEQESWSLGALEGVSPANLLSDHPWGVHRWRGQVLVTQRLDVVGTEVGSIGLVFPAELGVPPPALGRMLDTVAEQLDTVLEAVHTAAEKQQLTLQLSELLANPVFEVGMDQAILALAQRVKLPGFLMVYRDEVTSTLHYRVYRFGHLEYDSATRPFPKVAEAIAAHGTGLIARGNNQLRKALEPHRTLEAVLIAGAGNADPLGKIVVWSESEAFSAFAMDVLRLLASTLSQRLVDYNRERSNLSQFFSCAVIDELIREPDYEASYLTPREEEIGILFADINAFTKVCELVLETPPRIGRFVDRWSQGVVEILWKHAGVFDKMVGDCVIGLFGPPFFRSDRAERAGAAMRAACEIQAFTAAMSCDSDIARVCDAVGLPGLGVAVGVNLASALCGMFGPNHSYTCFSSGMNQTARLQGLGKFRETLVMESVRQALEGSQDPFFRSLTYGPLTETPVKNVAHPLRHYKLMPLTP